ncbi:ATP-NAD_kinase family protein [Hexamita inflata]|uniref:ATP-NAD_kinase family protein n=1 Tax=Hexamita inflata TaxID=28002 RepID=A0ABP1GKK3_9EUKA
MSSKPLILDQKLLKIKVSKAARGSCMVCFDGRNQVEMQPGDSVIISRNQWDVLSVCEQNEGIDWFNGLRKCLNWNVRVEQKQFGSGKEQQREMEVGDIDSDFE